jgi:hypothetical protein
MNHEEEKIKKRLAPEQKKVLAMEKKLLDMERKGERPTANRAIRASMALPCPRVVELYAVRAPRERRAVNAFFKAFC